MKLPSINDDRGENNSSAGGIGLAGAVFLVFLTLKLLGKIRWSWWWVTAPLWGGLAIATVALLVLLAVVIYNVALRDSK